MSFVCPTCKVDCRPIGTNISGIGIEEFDQVTGWHCIGETFETKCLANAALKKIGDGTKEYRVYSVFQK